jgi:hypothetical protein
VWDSFLFLMLKIHILAGAIAAFIAFPAAIFSRKGSKIHQWSGLLFVACFCSICGGGYLLEFENLQGTVVDIYGIDFMVSPFAKNIKIDYLAIVNTAMVNTMALYVAVSGWRIWKRAEAAEKGLFPRFDTLFASLYLLSGLVFAMTLWVAFDKKQEVEHLSHLTMEFAHLIIIAATAYVAYDACIDLYINIFCKPPRQWWPIHARKMISAEMGLAAAFPYRCGDMAGMVGLWMLVAMDIIFVIGFAVAWAHRTKVNRDLQLE